MVKCRASSKSGISKCGVDRAIEIENVKHKDILSLPSDSVFNVQVPSTCRIPSTKASPGMEEARSTTAASPSTQP